jgi:hypothetical protein
MKKDQKISQIDLDYHKKIRENVSKFIVFKVLPLSDTACWNKSKSSYVICKTENCSAGAS